MNKIENGRDIVIKTLEITIPELKVIHSNNNLNRSFNLFLLYSLFYLEKLREVSQNKDYYDNDQYINFSGSIARTFFTEWIVFFNIFIEREFNFKGKLCDFWNFIDNRTDVNTSLKEKLIDKKNFLSDLNHARNIAQHFEENKVKKHFEKNNSESTIFKSYIFIKHFEPNSKEPINSDDFSINPEIYLAIIKEIQNIISH